MINNFEINREQIFSLLHEKSLSPAMAELEEFSDSEKPSEGEISEYREHYFEHGKYVLNSILDQFRWFEIHEPFSEGEPILSWKHSYEFDGAKGYGFLGVNHERLETELDVYLEEGCRYINSDFLNRWVVDMMIFAECRLLAVESLGRLRLGLNNFRFWQVSKKRRFKDQLSKLIPVATNAYRHLDVETVDWRSLSTELDRSYREGVGWREPLRSFVAELASRPDV